MNRRSMMRGIGIVASGTLAACIGDDDADDAPPEGERHDVTPEEVVGVDPPDGWEETASDTGHREFRDDQKTIRVTIDADVADDVSGASDRYDDAVAEATDDGEYEAEPIDLADDAVSVQPGDDAVVNVVRKGNVTWTIRAEILWFPPEAFPDEMAGEFAERAVSLLDTEE